MQADDTTSSGESSQERASRALDARPFAFEGYWGFVGTAFQPHDLAAEVTRLVDPAAAIDTIHWGRNYLYSAQLLTGRGAVEVVVKQFRNMGVRRGLERRLKGSKASRSWHVAQALLAAGIATPAPVMLIESAQPGGPSFLVTRRLHGAQEVRHFFRRLNRATDAGEFPEVDPLAFLARLGRLARRLHDAGIWYRDLSMGNVLAVATEDGALELNLVDLNRARLGARLGVWRRTRDLCRLPIIEEEHREAFLGAYWGRVPRHHEIRWLLYTASVRGYLLKHSIKNSLRGEGATRRVSSGGKHHAHIPAADVAAARRDRAVWDHLSDQPHQHASRLDKLAIRLADSPSHLRDLTVVARAAPRVWRRYRELKAALHQAPQPFGGLGVCVRPWEQDPGAVVELLDDLGVRHILLRLHPWQDDHRAEEQLAAELAGRGYGLMFTIPQNRDLVRDPERWRAAVTQIAERFTPYGSSFQVGQAVNRSKWGAWTRGEYLDLYQQASEILRRFPGVEVMGPAVIDFEFQCTAALVNRLKRGVHFDVLSSLLYVDRRGAPENRQIGFDTIDKVVLLRAIADTGRCSGSRCSITEVNWPLWEGPHSPAGRKVSVDEQTQASFLARYYLLVLGAGLVERVYWWQLIARGYGLVTPTSGGELRRRPSFAALATLAAELDGASFLGPLPGAEGSYLYHFRRDGEDIVVGWSHPGDATATLPRPAVRTVDRDGGRLPVSAHRAVELSGSPVYFHLGE